MARPLERRVRSLLPSRARSITRDATILAPGSRRLTDLLDTRGWSHVREPIVYRHQWSLARDDQALEEQASFDTGDFQPPASTAVGLATAGVAHRHRGQGRLVARSGCKARAREIIDRLEAASEARWQASILDLAPTAQRCFAGRTVALENNDTHLRPRPVPRRSACSERCTRQARSSLPSGERIGRLPEPRRWS